MKLILNPAAKTEQTAILISYLDDSITELNVDAPPLAMASRA